MTARGGPLWARGWFVLLLAAWLLAGCWTRPTEQAAGQPTITITLTEAPVYPIPGQLFPAPQTVEAQPTPYPLATAFPTLEMPTPYPQPVNTQPPPTSAAQPSLTPTPPPTLELSPTVTPPLPEAQPTTVEPSATLEPTTEPTEAPTETATPSVTPEGGAYPWPTLPTPVSPYPLATEAATSTHTQAAPTATQSQATLAAASPTRTPTRTLTSAPAAGASRTPTPAASASATPTATASPDLTATWAMLTPTEYVPRPQASPTPYSGLRAGVSIWHSWTPAQREVLQQALRAFQGTFPDVTFDVLYVPAADLAARYQQAAYHGAGPTLVLGSSDWGAAFYDQGLVADLRPYMSPDFEASLAAPALVAGRYRNAQVGLPYAMQGVLLYRNTALISQPAADWQQMLTQAAEATRAGRLGLYFDWSPYFSGGIALAIGGAWCDDDGQPRLQQNNYAAALTWLELMQQAAGSPSQPVGGVGFGQPEIGRLFRAGRVGLILESSARLNELRQALGADNLALDPWPTYQGRALGGFVQTEQMYLNANVAGRSAAEQRAALLFMGMFMTPEIQFRLAEVGFIPTAPATTPRDPHLRQAQLALQTGVAFPPAWQGEIRSAYWSGMLLAAQQVAGGQAEPRQALEALYRDLQSRLQP